MFNAVLSLQIFVVLQFGQGLAQVGLSAVHYEINKGMERCMADPVLGAQGSEVNKHRSHP